MAPERFASAPAPGPKFDRQLLLISIQRLLSSAIQAPVNTSVDDGKTYYMFRSPESVFSQNDILRFHLQYDALMALPENERPVDFRYLRNFARDTQRIIDDRYDQFDLDYVRRFPNMLQQVQRMEQGATTIRDFTARRRLDFSGF